MDELFSALREELVPLAREVSDAHAGRDTRSSALANEWSVEVQVALICGDANGGSSTGPRSKFVVP